MQIFIELIVAQGTFILQVYTVLFHNVVTSERASLAACVSSAWALAWAS